MYHHDHPKHSHQLVELVRTLANPSTPKVKMQSQFEEDEIQSTLSYRKQNFVFQLCTIQPSCKDDCPRPHLCVNHWIPASVSLLQDFSKGVLFCSVYLLVIPRCSCPAVSASCCLSLNVHIFLLSIPHTKHKQSKPLELCNRFELAICKCGHPSDGWNLHSENKS